MIGEDETSLGISRYIRRYISERNESGGLWWTWSGRGVVVGAGFESAAATAARLGVSHLGDLLR
jgi:hypothetical protein